MSIYTINQKKLVPISERKMDLERDIQKLTEENLDILFGSTFVSGSLNQEFSVRAQEQDFYIDTLAFDESQKSFVIIEYKKDRSFSVIDQGFAYLSAMLNHKADFVLELNERLHKTVTKSDIDWEQSRVIFISPEFTNYQKNAINFKDLPIFLYEAHLYENNLVEYDAIKPYRASESITKLSHDKTIANVTKEVHVYNESDLVKPAWTNTADLLRQFEQQLMTTIRETKVKYTKYYIAYTCRRGHDIVNYVEIVPQQQGLKLYYRFYFNFTKSSLPLVDCSKVGHWTNGNTTTLLSSTDQFPEALRLASSSYDFIRQQTGKKK